MASKHASPAKRHKKFRGLAASANFLPLGMPIVDEKREKRRRDMYVMVRKLEAGIGFIGIIQVLGMRLNLAKRLLETLFTDEDQLHNVCLALTALIQVKVRLDESRRQLVGATEDEFNAIVTALNVADAIEDVVTPQELAVASRYVLNSHGTGADLVRR